MTELDILTPQQPTKKAGHVITEKDQIIFSRGKHIVIINQRDSHHEQVTVEQLKVFLKKQIQLDHLAEQQKDTENYQPEPHFWIDLQGLDEDEISEVCDIMSVHPLTKKDIFRQETREKCEFFANHIFIVINEIHYADGSNVLVAGTLNMLLFNRMIFTFHNEALLSTHQVIRMLKYTQTGTIPSASWIIYAYLDGIVDIYIDLVDKIMLETQSLDELVLVLSGMKQNELFTRIGLASRRVTNLHSGVFGKSEIISVLLRDDKFIPKDLFRYLRNVQDHVLRMLQKLTLSQRLLGNLNNIYMARVSLEVSDASNSVNRNMRKFTAISTIFIPLTLLSGIMGMNVRVPGNVGFEHGDNYYFFIGIIGIMCKRDALIFPGSKIDVSFWWIFKIRGTSDKYLYYDSLMDQENFIQGNFLRHERSALGLTMNEYIKDNPQGRQNQDAHFIAYNDHILSVNQKKARYKNTSFYKSGAHEKGFIGFKSLKNNGNKWKGSFIQHSLPKFPIPFYDKRNDLKVVPPFEFPTNIKNADFYYPYIGWGYWGVFGSNLLPWSAYDNLKTYLSPNSEISKKVVDLNQEDNDDDDSDGDADDIQVGGDSDDGEDMDTDDDLVDVNNNNSKKRKNQSQGGRGKKKLRLEDTPMKFYSKTEFQFFNNQGINLRARHFQPQRKPTQHIFCSSLDGPQEIKDLIEYLALLSVDGINSNFFDRDFKTLFKGKFGLKLDPTKIGTPFVPEKSTFKYGGKGNDGNVFFSGEDLKKPDLQKDSIKKYIESVFKKKITLGSTNYFMAINAASDNKNDIWKSLVICDANVQPCLERDSSKINTKFYVSTWVQQNNKNPWYQGIFQTDFHFRANVKFFKNKAQILWKPNTQQEHSKFAIKENSDANDWNICVSGGNLYEARAKPIKSSLLMCFANKGLHKAIKNLIVEGAPMVKDGKVVEDEKISNIISNKINSGKLTNMISIQSLLGNLNIPKKKFMATYANIHGHQKFSKSKVIEREEHERKMRLNPTEQVSTYSKIVMWPFAQQFNFPENVEKSDENKKIFEDIGKEFDKSFSGTLIKKLKADDWITRMEKKNH
ncbi:hypothetical protein CYY_000923 [Polysphondylium violaceum]|uniref:CorA family magnesium ion transporterr n=1 Tax=Polysphondylium violaceum TaxID=133409 RepID=A0A8J4Q403_9MYCE|nr:hypothetical protein CYY_000923 [Polysphondylium violaceum]